MDDLCHDLRQDLSNYNSTSISTPTVSQKEETSTPVLPCTLKKIPPCYPKLLTGTPEEKKQRYRKPDLVRLWKEGNCHELWSGPRPKTVKDYCHAFLSSSPHLLLTL